MIKVFDYIFYRIYRQYEKWRESYPFPYAEAIIIIIQIFIIYDVLTILSFFELFPKKIENAKYYGLVLAIILYLINHQRYKRSYIRILKFYDNQEDKNKKRNGTFIVIMICVVISFPIIIGIFRNNYGFDI